MWRSFFSFSKTSGLRLFSRGFASQDSVRPRSAVDQDSIRPRSDLGQTSGLRLLAMRFLRHPAIGGEVQRAETRNNTNHMNDSLRPRMEHGRNTESNPCLICVQPVAELLIFHPSAFSSRAAILAVGARCRQRPFPPMRPALAINGRWGTSPAAAVSHCHTTVYTTFHRGRLPTLHTKGLGRISPPALWVGCHLLYVNSSIQETAHVVPIARNPIGVAFSTLKGERLCVAAMARGIHAPFRL